MSPPYKYIWKIVAGGMGGVGKTTLLLRYLTHEFVGDTALTIGVNFHTSVVEQQGEKVTLLLWDLGGQERFRFIQSSYIKGAVAVLLFFDIGRLKTLYELDDWIKLIRDNTSPAIPILLVGTKLDLEDNDAQAQAKAEALNMVKECNLAGYVPTSSKSGENVEEVIHQVISILLKKRGLS